MPRLSLDTLPTSHDNLGSPLSQAPDRLLANPPVGPGDDGHAASEVHLGQLPVRLPVLGPVDQVLPNISGHLAKT